MDAAAAGEQTRKKKEIRAALHEELGATGASVKTTPPLGMWRAPTVSMWRHQNR